MRAVLTLHGVGMLGGRGPWQKAIAKVLEPHFHCVTIKYPHYRWLGLLSAVVEPWLLIPGVGILLMLTRHRTIHFAWVWLFGIVVASCLAAQVRRRMALSYFITQVSRRISFGSRPHVIAHSMGTKLVGTALRDFPQVRLAGIVLAGCVLPTDYPWRDAYNSNPEAFQRIRNEVGLRDSCLGLHVRLRGLGCFEGMGRLAGTDSTNWTG